MSSYAFIRNETTNKVAKKTLSLSNHPRINNNMTTLKNTDGNLNVSVLSIDGIPITSSGNQLNYVNSVTNGIGAANKALITDNSNNISNINILSCKQLIVNGNTITLTSNNNSGSSESNSPYLQKIKIGEVQSTKALVLDANKNIETINKLSVNQLQMSNNKIINNSSEYINRKKIHPITLNNVNSTISNNLIGICWSSELSLAVAIANTGTTQIYTSSNGINWTPQTTPANNNWTTITWVSELSLFVVLANSGTYRIMTSPDGINWSLTNLDIYPVSISLGNYGGFILTNIGQLYGFGQNSYGELTSGNTSGYSLPTLMPTINNLSKIEFGQQFSIFLLNDGTVKSIGNNSSGQLGNGNTTNQTTLQTISNLSNVTNISVSCDNCHCLALLSDNTIKSWGLNNNGQLGNSSTSNSNVPVSVSGISNAIAISAGFDHSMALLSDGTIKTWGYNINGQLGNGSTTSSSVPVSVSGINNAIAISAGSGFSVALLSDGTIKTWGINNNSQLGDTTTTNRSTPVSVSGISNAIAISAGDLHTIALLNDGTIKTWGYNGNYQLGDGTTTNRSSPVSISNVSNVNYIKARYHQTFIMLNDKTVLRWGYNGNYQLADGTTTRIQIPTGNFDYWSLKQQWSSICWSPQLSLLVAVSNSGVNGSTMISSNGINWNTYPGIANNWTSICWSPELTLFAAVSNNGLTNRIMTSSNGITWTTRNNNYLQNWTSVCWVPRVKLFIAVANSGIFYRVMTSSDGITWTVQYSPFYSNWSYIYDVPELNMTVAIANSGNDKIMYSYNGLEWFLSSVNINYPLTSITWAKELNKFLITSGNTYNYTDITYSNTNLMTTSNWYTMFTFTKIILSSSYTMVQTGSNPDVQLQISSTSAGNTINSLWYNQRIQDATTFTINFEIKLSGTADASSFNIGHVNSSFLGEAPNAPAFSLVFHMNSSTRPVGLYLFDNNGILINYYAYTLSENVWRAVQIIYNNSSTNTWQFYYNSVNIFNYSNPNHSSWINTSGSYFGFGSRTGGSMHDCTIRRFTLSGNFVNTQTSNTINSNIFNSNIITNSSGFKNYGRSLNALTNGDNLYINKYIGTVNNYSVNYSFNPSQVIWISELKIYIMGNTSNNTVAYSYDGENWLTSTTITGYTIRSLCWSPELRLIVAVSSAGSNNNVITSPDGITWTLRTNVPSTVIPWYGVCWSSPLNLFVAVGYGANDVINRVMTSSDGIVWTLRKSAVQNCSWSNVCWSTELNIFVAISNTGNWQSMYSFNGIDWICGNNNMYGSTSSMAFVSLCWSPQLNLFAAVSNDRVITSSDGITWTARVLTSNTWTSICWVTSMNMFIAVANASSNNLVYSIDGINWTYKSLVLSDPQLYSICYNPDFQIFTAVGNSKVLNYPLQKYGYNSFNSNNNLLYFNNPDNLNNISYYDNWNYLSNGSNNQWTSICYSPDLNILAAVANSGTGNRIIISTDGGYTWANQTNPVDNNWTSICYSVELTLFVAVSNSGSNDRVMTSSDGINWTSRVSASDNNWTSVCYSSDLTLFVAVSNTGSNDRVMTSPDGINWTSRMSSSSNNWTSVCYSSDLTLFVAVSNSGTGNRVMTSSDGINWTSRVSASDNNWTSVCYSSKLRLFTAVANSGTNRVMLSNDGINWYNNNIIYKQVSSPKTLSMNSIFAGNLYSFAIHGDSGMLKGWGYDAAGYSATNALGNYPILQTNTFNVKKIVGSGYVTKYLLNNGTVQTRGYNGSGEIGHISNSMNYNNMIYTIPNINNAIDIASGYNYATILLNDGTLKSWGTNNYGQLGNGNTTNQYQPASVSSINNGSSISAHTDGYHTLALLNDGTVKSWGLNTYGQLGNNSTTNSSSPVSVSNITNAIAISAGGNHSLALLSDGTIVSWGLNSSGQLGNNSTTNSSIPVSVSGITNAIAISAGNEFSLALLSDGTVKSWGKNTNGQLGNANTGTNQLTPVSVSNLTNIIAISAGSSHAIALLNNGTLKSWGYNTRGQLGNGNTTDSNIPVTVLHSSSGDTLNNIKIDKTLSSDFANNDWTSICWSEEMKIFIAISNSGNYNRIMVSNDGYIWYSKTTNENNNFTAICWADLLSKFIIIASNGTNNILYSNVKIPTILSGLTSLGNYQLYSNTSNNLLIGGTNSFDKLNISDINNNLLRLSYNNSTTNSVDFTVSYSPNFQINIINNSNNKITNIVNHNGSSYGLSFNGTLVKATASDLNKLNVSTFGQAESSKALIANSSVNISNINNITMNKLIVNNKIIFNSTDNSSNYLSGITPGIADTQKALVLDSNKNIEYLNKISTSGIYLNNFNNITTNITSTLDKNRHYTADLIPTNFKYPTNISYKNIIWVADFNLFIGSGLTVSQSSNYTSYTINVSSDGINWKNVDSIPFDTTNYILSFAYSPSLRMVVGYTNNLLYYSYNGYNWYTKTLGSPTLFTSICWAGSLNLFVATSGATSQVYTSPDGINWTVRTAASGNNWTSICWSPDLSLLVAVSITGTGTRVMTSSNGTSWTTRTSAADNNWTSVCWSPSLSLFVAVSNSGVNNRVMTSPDGTNWTIRTSAANNNWTSVCWASNLSLFVAVASSSASNNCIMKSSDGINWSTIDTSTFNSNYYTIAYSPELNLLVAGSDGSNSYSNIKIITSSNGTNWTLQPTNYDLNWYDMTYIPELSLFITISNTNQQYINQFAKSSNGIDWTLGKILSSGQLACRSMAWSSSLSSLIVCASNQTTTFYKTSDCINWTSITVPDGNWIYVKWISQLNIYIALASGGTNRIIKSSNGTNWTVITLPSTQALYTVDYSSALNMLIVVSNGNPSIYFTSTDGGNTWTQRSIIIGGSNVSLTSEVSITWISQLNLFLLFVTNNTYTYYISYDGINWILVSIPANASATGSYAGMSNIITGKPVWIPKLNKLYNLSYQIGGPLLMESGDGINWKMTYRIGGMIPYNNLCWSNELETLIGYGNSTNQIPGFPFVYLNQYLDPVKKYNINAINNLNKLSKTQVDNSITTWISRTNPVDNDLTSICYSAELNLFVAVSNTGTNNRVLTSPDSINWTVRTSAANNNWTSICWAPELTLFAAVANTGTGNRIMTSPNGITWTSRTSPADNNWTSICWANDLQLFVAVSNSGTGNRIMISSNGLDWQLRTNPVDNDWISICWSNDLTLFVAVSNSGTGDRIMTSYNGITWTSRTSPVDNNWTSICWSQIHGLFVAVANSGTGDRIMTSSDGINWTLRTNPVDNNWTSICIATNLQTFIAVANTGTGDRIMTSADGINWTSRNNSIDNNWTSICWSNAYNLAVAVSNSGTGNRILTSTLASQYIQNNYACLPNTLYINQSNGNVGLGTYTPNYQLELSTDSAGKPSTAYWTISSDSRLKENIEDADINICYNNVKNLRLVKYTWKDDIYQNVDEEPINNKTQLGWIADEVENILPKSIRTVNAYNLKDCKTLDSDQIIASMYGTIKKILNDFENQNNQINVLKTEIDQLENIINELNIV